MIGQTVSHYRILERLGEGGMGVVYKALDTHLDRPVALKFLPPHLGTDKDARSRFIQEAKSASSLEHTNICNIHDIDETDDGRLFIAMSCYEGESLKDKIARGPLPIEEAIDYAIQIAQGLAKAHKRDIIHRDIKPGNVMVTGRGEVKIVDFGLAKMAESSLTKTGSTLGTAMYMSPEQARGETVDHRTDIWSLGVVLYEMLTGRPPFKGDYEAAVLYQVVNEEPDPISAFRPEVPTPLITVGHKLLQKDPGDRYAGMGVLLAELRSVQQTLTEVKKVEEKRVPSIAVLAFANMSADPEQEYFCDGMAEEIINVLSHIENLKVIARTSAFMFKGKQEDIREIGKKLDVEHLLEGSVRKAGNRIRITAQLINVTDGSHLWSERFDRNMDDVFAIQDEISLAIVDTLKVKLLESEAHRIDKKATRNIEAYNLYLLGKHQVELFTKAGFFRSIDCFKQALELDPNYALAYSGLALSYRFLGTAHGYLSPKEAMPKSREFAQKALAIDENLAEAHLIMADIHRDYDLQLITAEREYKRAIELSPGFSDAYTYSSLLLGLTGRYEEAFEQNRIAWQIDPISWLHWYVGGWVNYCARNYDQAQELWQKATGIFPNSPLILSSIAALQADMGLSKKAVISARNAERISIESPWHLSIIAYAYYRLGNTDESNRIHIELEKRTDEPGAPGAIVLLYAACGEVDRAIDWLKKAYDERSQVLILLNAPWFDSIREHEGYKEVLKKMGLETTDRPQYFRLSNP